VTGDDARLHVTARLPVRTVRLTVTGPGRPDVNVDMDEAAVREVAAALLDALAALEAARADG